MNIRFKLLELAWSKVKRYYILFFFLLLMLLIHHYVFLYADDFYYCRDASASFSTLPRFMNKQLSTNGRVWVHLLLLVNLKYNVYLFRIINPVVIMLTALMIAKVITGSDAANKKFVVSTACTCMFFILLPIETSGTTIYYAACSLNYLYPTGISILYGYLLYNNYSKDNYKSETNWWIVVLAFFAASSTQQAGMIAVGFTVLNSLYFRFLKKKRFKKSSIPYYCAIFIGYSIVTYGSINRAIFEKSTGKSSNIPATIDGMLKTNIFGIPASGYVLILCLCSIYWLYHYSFVDNKNISKFIVLFNKMLAFTLSLATLGYFYCVLYKKYDFNIMIGDNINIMLRLCYVAFTLIYLFSILNVSVLILLKEGYAFLLFCCINAFGAQIMLIAVDPRFAGNYKLVFPSLLLMSIFITYSFAKFYNSNIFLALALLAIALSINNTNMIKVAFAFVVVFVLCKLFSTDIKLIKGAMVVSFVIIALVIFRTNYDGYKAASYVQNFNMNAIVQYQLRTDKSVLKLKRIVPTKYGYNVGNWNNMPYFMKQCYNISENTDIEYYK